MTPGEYIKRAREFDNHSHYSQQVTSALGLAAEAGEVANEIERAFRLVPDGTRIQGLDRDKLKAEMGDVLWHLSRLADINEWTFEELMEENIAKLEERYAREGLSRRTDG